MPSKVVTLSIILGTLAIGVFAGHLLGDIPYLTLDKEINVLDLASLIVTTAIAFMIPFAVTKLIEDKRSQKTWIIDEFRDLITLTAKAKSIILCAHSNHIIVAADKDAILYALDEADLKANLVCEQLKVAFPKHSETIAKDLKEHLFEYQHFLTGGSLMASTFIEIDDRFYKESNTAYSKVETGFKILIQKIYKF